MRRFAAVMGVVVAAGVAPLVTAVPAHADQIDCVNCLKGKGYTIGPKVRAACDGVESLGEKAACQISLIGIGVKPPHALGACVRA